MILETRHLRLVGAVAEHGTLTRAGRVLNLTQSGLSRQLLDLETRLGLPLFHRLGKRMVPTSAGERLLAAARRALPQLADVEEELRRLAGGRAAILRVSTECYTCYHWLPGVLPRFTRRFPQVDVQIVAEATHHPCRRCWTAASTSRSCRTTITTTGSPTSRCSATSWSRCSAPTIR